MQRTRRFGAAWDARILVWGLLFVFLTGSVLMIGYRPGNGEVAPWAAFLVDLHAAGTAWVVWGTLIHLVWRTVRAGATVRGIRSGAWAFLSVGVAVVTGVLAAPVDTWAWLARPFGDDARLLATVGHVAYASILVLLTLYMHVARWGWSRVLGSPMQAFVAIALTVVLALLWGVGGSISLVPPLPVLWAWTLLLPLAVALAARPLARSPPP